MTAQNQKTLTQKIISHRGFIPVVFLLLLSVLTSGLGRYADHSQRDLNTNGHKAIATVTKTYTGKSKRSGRLGGTEIRHFMILEYTISGDKTFRNHRQVSLEKLKTIKLGDKYTITYDPKNPGVMLLKSDEFASLADRIRTLAWALFFAALLLAGYHFLKYRMAQRQKRWENQ